jgi:Fe-S cluster assembly protein SufD
MIDVQEKMNTYQANFARFEEELGSDANSSFHALRKAALERFLKLGFPGPRDEDWKFTNLATLAKTPFKSVAANTQHDLTLADLEETTFSLGGMHRLVFVDGNFEPELSASAGLPKNVVVGSLDAWRERAEPHLGKYASFANHAFIALNTAFIADGAFVELPPGTVVEKPICILFVSTLDGTVTHPRCLIRVGANSEVRIVEAYVDMRVSPTRQRGAKEESSLARRANGRANKYFTNAVTEVVAGENARIDHYRLQRESLEAFHVGVTQVQMERNSRFTSHYLGLGGKLVRNEVRANLGAEECECTLNGLYLAAGAQHLDNFTVIDHAMPRCASHELYKGILDDKSHGVFNGKIFVHQDAQKTDAKQTNQTLLLSDYAVINTKPQLEIYADDVKCTHGATVGQLDAESIFYLRSRGIGLAQARALLTFAFANDIVNRVAVEPLRVKLSEQLLELHALPAAEGER